MRYNRNLMKITIIEHKNTLFLFKEEFSSDIGGGTHLCPSDIFGAEIIDLDNGDTDPHESFNVVKTLDVTDEQMEKIEEWFSCCNELGKITSEEFLAVLSKIM